MPNAKPRDMRAGYDLYVRRNGAIRLEELNVTLEQSGYGPVSARAIDHFGKLLKTGFDRYIPINRYDVARSYRPYENLSLLSRYRYRPTHQEVEIRFHKKDRIQSAAGIITHVGDAGAVVQFSDQEVVDDLCRLKPRPGDEMVVQFTATNETIPSLATDVDLSQTPAIVEVEYLRLLSVGILGGSQPLQVANAEFTLVSEEGHAANIDVVGRRIHHFFDLLEGLRAILNEVGRHAAEPVYAPPPVVDEIRMASPTLLVLQVPIELISLLPLSLLGGMIYLPKAIAARKSWHEGSLIKEERIRKKSEARALGRSLDRGHLDDVHNELRKQIRADHPTSSISGDDIDTMIQAYALPPCSALERTDIREITVTIRFLGTSEQE